MIAAALGLVCTGLSAGAASGAIMRPAGRAVSADVSKPVTPPVYRPRFRRVAGVAVESSLDGTVLIKNAPVDDPDDVPLGGTLIVANGSSSYSVSPPPSCPLLFLPPSWPVVGAGSALYPCQTSQSPPAFNFQISTPPSTSWTAVDGSAATALCLSYYNSGGGSCRVAAVGRVWIELQFNAEHVHGFVYRLVNIATGAIAADPSAANVITDLNTTNPARRRCSTLNAKGGGLVRFIGGLALVATPGADNAHIQSCNSTASTRVGADASAAAGAIVWTRGPNDTVIRGIQARTRRRFTIAIPSLLGHQLDGGLAITKTTLYIGGDFRNQHVWAAPLPVALRAGAQ